MSAARAEVSKILRRAQRQGLVVERTGGGHWKVTSPESGQFCIAAFSPRSTNMRNLVRNLKQIGYKE